MPKFWSMRPKDNKPQAVVQNYRATINWPVGFYPSQSQAANPYGVGIPPSLPYLRLTTGGVLTAPVVQPKNPKTEQELLERKEEITKIVKLTNPGEFILHGSAIYRMAAFRSWITGSHSYAGVPLDRYTLTSYIEVMMSDTDPDIGDTNRVNDLDIICTEEGLKNLSSMLPLQTEDAYDMLTAAFREYGGSALFNASFIKKVTSSGINLDIFVVKDGWTPEEFLRQRQAAGGIFTMHAVYYDGDWNEAYEGALEDATNRRIKFFPWMTNGWTHRHLVGRYVSKALPRLIDSGWAFSPTRFMDPHKEGYPFESWRIFNVGARRSEGYRTTISGSYNRKWDNPFHEAECSCPSKRCVVSLDSPEAADYGDTACGIYSYKDPKSAVDGIIGVWGALVSFPPVEFVNSQFIARCHNYGRVVEGENGYKATNTKVVEVFHPSQHVLDAIRDKWGTNVKYTKFTKEDIQNGSYWYTR